MAKRQALRDAILVGRVDRGGATEVAAALGVLGLAEVAPAGAGAHDFPAGGDFEPLGHGLLGSDAFRTSHKCLTVFQKERAI